MLRFQKGDREAFDELVRRNTPRVHALLYRFLSGSDQIEDLTQEVFMRVFRNAHRYRPRAKFGTWLYRITANLAFNVLRGRKRIKFSQLETSEDSEGYVARNISDSSAPMPNEGLDGSEMRQKVIDALDTLPEDQKVAIILNKYERKTHGEIAEILNRSPMAVKSLLSRARKNLHEKIEGYLKGR